MRPWIWIIIGVLAAWDILSLLPVPPDPGAAFQGVMEPPNLMLQGAWVAALLVALALWRLYQRRRAMTSKIDRLLLSGAIKSTETAYYDMRAVLRREGVLLSTFAVAGALAFSYLLVLALVAASKVIIAWMVS